MIERISKTALVLFSIIIAFQISLILPGLNWETDYGHLYYISSFNQDKKLYYDFFNHKGPFVISFIDFLSLPIGYGWKQSITIFFITTLILFLTSLIFTQRYSKKTIVSFFSIIFLISFFRSQGSNIYLDLIINTLILLSFNFLLIYFKNLKIIYFYISIFIMALAILTRIDACLYLLLHVLFFLFYEKKFRFKFYLKLIFFNSLIFFTIFTFFKIINNFTIEEYFVSNILFNLTYSQNFYSFTNLSSLYHFLPNKIIVFLLLTKIHFYFQFYNNNSSKLFVILCILSFFQAIIFFIKYDDVITFVLIFLFEIIIIFYLVKKNNYFNKVTVFSIFLFIFTILLFLLTGTNKLNHALILLPGSLIFFIFITDYIFSLSQNLKIIFSILLIFLCLNQLFKFEKNNYLDLSRNNYLNYENGIQNFFYNDIEIKKNELLKTIRKKNIPVICDRGWLHVFKNKESNTYMFDWWQYEETNGQKNIIKGKFTELINDLKNDKYQTFLIDNACLKNDISQHSSIKIFLKNSYQIKNYKFFNYHYSLRKFYE